MDELMFGEVAFSGIESLQDSEKLKNIAKSLSVGYEHGVTDQVGFGAPRISSLEETMKMAVAEEKSCKFIKALRHNRARSTVEEFASLQNIGWANFYSEGGLPNEYDEELKREFEYVKYLGTVGKVPIPATVVDSIVDNLALMKKAKAIAILRTADVKVFWADSAKISTEFNGIYKQFTSRVKDSTRNVIDLAGKRLSPEILNEIAAKMMTVPSYGDPDNIKGWIAADAFQNYIDELLANRRFMVGSAEARTIIANAKTFQLGNGSGQLETDIFLKFKGQSYLDAEYPKLNSAGTAFAAMHAQAPATLDANSASASSAGTGGLITAATYDYAVVPVNKYGAGAAFEIASVVVGAAEKVTFTVADNGSPAGQEATAVEIYRKLHSATAKTSYQFVASFAITDTIIDDGSEIPGTTYGFFFDWNFDQVIDFKQLLPMQQMPLAIIDDSVRWLQKWYCTPIVYNANKIIVVKNIGSTAWS